MIGFIATIIWFIIVAFLVVIGIGLAFVILVNVGYLFTILDKKVQKCFSNWGRQLSKFRK